MREYTLRVREGLAYMPYAPVLFISAQTGQRVDKLFSLIHEVYEQNHMRIPTGRLNAILAEATARVQPPTDKGRRLRIFYMTQAPPVRRHSSASAMTRVCSISPISAIWKTRSVRCSV